MDFSGEGDSWGRVLVEPSFAGTEIQIPESISRNKHIHIKAVCRVAKVNKPTTNHTKKYDVAMNVHRWFAPSFNFND